MVSVSEVVSIFRASSTRLKHRQCPTILLDLWCALFI